VPRQGIHFEVEERLNFSLEKQAKISKWIRAIAKEEGKAIGHISYLFCTDDNLLNINRQFLKHDFYTDIITFDYSEKEKIEGEIFISIDRVKENAASFREPSENELMRTIIHGILHLCGYKDKTPADKKRMRERENKALLNI